MNELTITSASSGLTYVFDLDGVIYRGVEPQPHSREIIAALKAAGHTVRYFTNNSAQTRPNYSAKLTNMGIPTSIDEIMTSSYATALYLQDKGVTSGTAYKVGGAGIFEELEAIGIRVLSDDEEMDAEIDFVVVGLDRKFNYDKLKRAQNAILNGAQFIATNADPTFPMESGTLLPGGGCMVAAVRTATDVQPIVIGKPETYAFDKILQLTNTLPENAVMVGDRLDTDILVGNRAGAQSVLVLTGVSTREEGLAAEGLLKPTRIIDTLAELI